MKIQEINVTTGEEIVRDLTAEELAQYELDQNEINQANQNAAKAKELALTKLTEIGLTLDDLAALGL